MFLSGKGYPGGYIPGNPGHPSRGSWLASPVRVWFLEAAYAVIFFATLTILFLVPFISRQYSRFGRFAGWPAFTSAAFALYACALVAFTLFPFPDFADGYCRRRSDVDHWQLNPLASLDDVTAYAADYGLPATLTSAVFLQVAMNVAFFLPLGFFLAYRSRRSLAFTALAAFGISLAIELTQGTGLWGLAPCPYRLADVDDLITNTAGGMLGWLIGITALRFLPDARPSRTPDPGPPGAPRQMVGALLDVQVYLLVQVALLIAADRLGITLTVESEFLGSFAGWAQELDFAIVSIVVTLVMFVVIPRLRKDRASVGFASVHLALVRPGDKQSAGALALLGRWAIRWLPVVVFGLVALVVIFPIEALVVLLNRRRRSLSSIVTRTEFITREAALGANRSEPEPADL